MGFWHTMGVVALSGVAVLALLDDLRQRKSRARWSEMWMESQAKLCGKDTANARLEYDCRVWQQRAQQWKAYACQIHSRLPAAQQKGFPPPIPYGRTQAEQGEVL